jgi:L-fucose/D-arabinose isomerase
MKRTVDIYLPLDSRDAPNAEVWPVAKKQLEDIVTVVRKSGWEPNILNPDKPVASVVEGLKVIKKAKGDRFINFHSGWTYPDFSVSPMWQLPREVPKLMLGSSIKDFPGNVGLLAAAAGIAQMGIDTSRLYVENFKDHAFYQEAMDAFLNQGTYSPTIPDPIDVKISPDDRDRARNAVTRLNGMVYGAVGPRSMQMWNKISDADFLKYFGVSREGFDGLRVLKMAEKISDDRAEKALNFLLDKGMDMQFGTDPDKHLTREMVLFQMKVYFALLELKEQFGLDFMGVQDQLDWIEHYPATDLTLGLLNNRLRPETDGETFVVSTEADDGAAVTMQMLKMLSGGEPVGFNDFRYWNADGLFWFVNSGALAPYFGSGSHDTLKGSWSVRQTYMYFQKGGGTSSVIARVPGVVTWARFSYRDHQLYLTAGRGVTDVPDEQQRIERSTNCNPEWPHWYIRLCGRPEWNLNSNHPMTAPGDHLGALKAVAEELGIPFECTDFKTPDQV